MKDRIKSDGISRRKFMKGIGSGVVGSTVLVHSLPAISEQLATAEAAHDGKQLLAFKVNGRAVKLMVEPRTTLAEVLRDSLQLTGTKIACNQGECGSCTVLLNGSAVYSCHLLALDAAGKEVTTIEGLMNGETLHPIQQAFIDKDGLQCGFCTPGQIMAAHALLMNNPTPSREQVQDGMGGNLCRCAAYPKIVDSVLAAAAAKFK
ncbi:MAG: (2Fe-2S)-binding protein [Candidatus Zhuqueibacterota bacterium]